ncbi:MAG: hypothetical protein ABH864_01790 [archaeon]
MTREVINQCFIDTVMAEPSRNGRLEYARVNGDGHVTVYEVRIPNVRSDGEGENSWGGRIGYRARASFRKPIYIEGHRNPIRHVYEEIEVVTNGPGLDKARQKIYRTTAFLSVNRKLRVQHQQKRSAAKARKKSRRATHSAYGYPSRPSKSWW